ncbi:MAG: PP2C family serine/threonine-protein phosphatase [Xylophilus ampelinus]
MTWAAVSAVSIGTSHRINGTDCQDECRAMVEPCRGEDILTMFVADGAGSASHGRDGALTAVQSAATFVLQHLDQHGLDLQTSLAEHCLDAVRRAIRNQAAAKCLAARDFACTFLGVVGTSRETLAFQIGDGGIVLDVGEGLELFAAPMTGEYANMTHFVTQDEWHDVFTAKVYSKQARRVAAFSDGLQRLALNMAESRPHPPFFAPFFNVLERATPPQEDALANQLVAFLDSRPVNERTDDDKSLALAALRIGEMK